MLNGSLLQVSFGANAIVAHGDVCALQPGILRSQNALSPFAPAPTQPVYSVIYGYIYTVYSVIDDSGSVPE